MIGGEALLRCFDSQAGTGLRTPGAVLAAGRGLRLLKCYFLSNLGGRTRTPLPLESSLVSRCVSVVDQQCRRQTYIDCNSSPSPFRLVLLDSFFCSLSLVGEDTVFVCRHLRRRRQSQFTGSHSCESTPPWQQSMTRNRPCVS